MSRPSMPRPLPLRSQSWSAGLPLSAVLLAGTLLPACSSGEGDGRRGPRGYGGPGGDRPEAAIPVEVRPVERGRIARVLNATTRLKPAAEVPLVARLSARLVELNVDVGDTVTVGQLLARVDDSETRHQFDEAESDSRNKANAAGRARRSFDSGLLAREAYEQTQSQSETARARTEQARMRLAWAGLTAPIDGVVLERDVEVGELLSPGQQLLSLGDVERLRADVNLPERDLGLVSVGQEVEILVDPFPDHVFRATVERIAPMVSADSGTFGVRIEVPARTGEGPRLLPGLFARARLLVDARPDALLIPQSALLLDRESDAVFVVTDGRAELREIETGYVDAGKVEVRKGLTDADRVVVLGQGSLTPGATARIVGEGGGTNQQGADPDQASPGAAQNSAPPGVDLSARIEQLKQHPGFRKRWDAAVEADPQLATDPAKQRAFMAESMSRRGGRR